MPRFQSTRPSWGATNCNARYTTKSGISIHAPVWGATPRHPAHLRRRRISIHAPVWGATPSVSWRPADPAFQSTRPCGARLCAQHMDVLVPTFQSTRPCGARLALLPIKNLLWEFQSTRPRGARQEKEARQERPHGISIHAPVWGATTTWSDRCRKIGHFNPRARVGRD